MQELPEGAAEPDLPPIQGEVHLPAGRWHRDPVSYADASKAPGKQPPEFLKDDPAFLAVLANSSITVTQIIETITPLTTLKRLGGLCIMSSAIVNGKRTSLWRITPAGEINQAIADVISIATVLSAYLPLGWYYASPWAASYASAIISYPHRLPTDDPEHLVPILRKGLAATYPGISVASVKPQFHGSTFAMTYVAIVRTASLPAAKRIRFSNEYATQLSWSWYADSTPSGSKFFNGWHLLKDMNALHRQDIQRKRSRSPPAADPPSVPTPATMPAPAPALAAAPALSPAATLPVTSAGGPPSASLSPLPLEPVSPSLLEAKAPATPAPLVKDCRKRPSSPTSASRAPTCLPTVKNGASQLQSSQ